MSRHDSATEPEAPATADDDERLPVDLRNRIVLHGETSPYHRRLQQELDVNYADLRTWTDIRETFDYLDDEALRALEPEELTPEQYEPAELVPSQSSGTTGPVKELYWHEEDLRDNVANMIRWLERIDVPKDAHWS